MSQKKTTDFGDLLNELEGVVDWFDREEVDLNQALKKYERGLELVAELKKQLQAAKTKVKRIDAKFGDK